MSWRWEYALGAEKAALTAPRAFLAQVERKAAELARAAEALHLHGRASRELNPQGGDMAVPGGMFSYQVVVRQECVYVLQITYLGY